MQIQAAYFSPPIRDANVAALMNAQLISNTGLGHDERVKLRGRIFLWTWVAAILVCTGLASTVWYIYWYLWPTYRAGSPPSSEEMSRLGSYLQGAVGSLWALASVLFIYIAFLGQRVQI